MQGRSANLCKAPSMSTQNPIRTTLLGAGASVEAGLPISSQLTEQIARAVDVRGNLLGSALNIAIGAMVAHDTARGGKPFDGIDVERLFSAVQMLGQRDQLEVAPFVASWNEALEVVAGPGEVPSFFRKNFRKALTSNFESDLDRLFADAVTAVSKRNPERIFQRLEKRMLDQLGRLLTVDPDRIDYLRPLLDRSDGPVQIATLNYDRTIETAAQKSGLLVDTGIEGWKGTYDWSWAKESDVRLLKLHGSTDWWIGQNGGDSLKMGEESIVVGNQGTGRWAERPGLVFGQRGKLRSDGPFLAMLRAFDDFLSRTDELLIIGYSFRDEHINASIRRWVNAGATRPLVVVDPNPSELARSSPFFKELSYFMSKKGYADPAREVATQFSVIETGAGAAIQQLAE